MARQKKLKAPKPPKPPKFLELWQACANPWTPHELHLYGLPCASFEGRGEKPYRFRQNLDLTPVQGPCDIPRLKTEIKNIESCGKLSATIRLGHSTKDMYFGDSFEAIIRWDSFARTHKLFDKIDVELIRRFKCLAFSKETVSELPEVLGKIVNENLLTFKVLGHYDVIVLVSSYGFIEIPKKDFDEAFSFSSTTQARLQYLFNWRTYLTKVL